MTEVERETWLAQECRKIDAYWENYKAKYGIKAYHKKMYGSNPEWERMDSRISMSTQEFLEDIWNNEGIVPVGIEEEKRHHRSRTLRPYIGCPDCPRWDGRRCVKQFEDTKLCEEIEERYKEKGE